MTSTISDALKSPPLHIDGFDDPRLHYGIAGRSGGVSGPPFQSLNLSVKTGDNLIHVEQNRRAFEKLMRIETRQVAFGRLSHGDNIVAFKLGGMIPNLIPPDLGWPMFDGDAAISNVPGLMLVMTFADCVPILLWDEGQGVCGLVHAGWRGTALNIVSKTIKALGDTFGTNPASLHAAIGPCIGQCCYPVSENVQVAMVRAYQGHSGQFFQDERLDLVAANSFDLASAGVSPGRIHTAGVCTSCNKDQFFSHRAEQGQTGRFGACIGLRYPDRFVDSDRGDARSI